LFLSGVLDLERDLDERDLLFPPAAGGERDLDLDLLRLLDFRESFIDGLRDLERRRLRERLRLRERGGPGESTI